MPLCRFAFENARRTSCRYLIIFVGRLALLKFQNTHEIAEPHRRVALLSDTTQRRCGSCTGANQGTIPNTSLQLLSPCRTFQVPSRPQTGPNMHLLKFKRSRFQRSLEYLGLQRQTTPCHNTMSIYLPHNTEAEAEGCGPCSVHCIRIYGYGVGMSLCGLGGAKI